MVGAGFSFLGRCGAGCHYEGLYQCHCVNGIIISPGIVSGRDEQQNVFVQGAEPGGHIPYQAGG